MVGNDKASLPIEKMAYFFHKSDEPLVRSPESLLSDKMVLILCLETAKQHEILCLNTTLYTLHFLLKGNFNKI